MGHVHFPGPPRTGDPVCSSTVKTVSLPVSPPTANPLDQCTCRARGLHWGVMILIEADWAQPWFPCVLASDASLSGYGVAQSFWSV